jgi:uncharacterized membrane protein (DUF485 family)
MKTSSASRLDQTRFRELVARKRAVSATLTALILAVYFGFILVLAFHRDLLALKVGEHLTMGVPVGLAVIVSACVLTGVYVAWANSVYDESVRDLVEGMREEGK